MKWDVLELEKTVCYPRLTFHSHRSNVCADETQKGLQGNKAIWRVSFLCPDKSRNTFHLFDYERYVNEVFVELDPADDPKPPMVPYYAPYWRFSKIFSSLTFLTPMVWTFLIGNRESTDYLVDSNQSMFSILTFFFIGCDRYYCCSCCNPFPKFCSAENATHRWDNFGRHSVCLANSGLE